MPELKTKAASSVGRTATAGGAASTGAVDHGGCQGCIEVQDAVGAEVRGQQPDTGTVGDAVAGPGQAERRADLEGLPGRIEHDGRRSDLAGGVDRHHELGAVRRHHRHPVTAPDAAVDEVQRQRVGRAVELAVGPAVVARQHGGVVGEPFRRRLEPAMHEARCHGETFFSELRFSVNTHEVYGYRCEEGGPGSVVTSPDPAATDEDVRSEIIATVRRFVEREVIPAASELERSDTFPERIVAQMRELGLFGVTIPEEFGGLGLDLLTYIGIIEELAYGWMSLTGIVNTHTMAATLLMTHGTEEQKQRWLPAMASGERRGCLSLSEPDAGSDTRNISCRAARDGDEYVINGSKAWVTNGERAAIVALAARTEEGITAFIVEKEPGGRFEGIAVSKHVGKLGYRGVETVEMAYTDHRIPAANVIGDLGRGLPQILGVLEVGRINIAARAVGVARAAFDAALAYSMQRETMGKVIGEHQAIQLKLADMATRLEAARLLTRNAAERRSKGLRCDVEAGMAKLFASETALELATEAMRIHGGVGYTTEFPVERYYRDAPLMIIGEGTNEIQRIVIARGLLARARAQG